MKKIIFLMFVIIAFAINASAQTDSVKIISIMPNTDTVIYGVHFTPNFVVKNCGTNVITYLSVEYSRDSYIQQLDTFYMNLAQNDTAIIVLQHDGPGVSDIDVCIRVENGIVADFACKSLFTLIADADLGVSKLIYPNENSYIPPGTPIRPKIQITNYGLSPQGNIPLSFVAGNYSTGGIYYYGIPPGDSVIYTFQNSYIQPSGLYTICAKTNLSYDSNSLNDENCIVLTALKENDNIILSSIYPNPASNSTTIIYSSKFSDEIKLTIRDIQGRLIYQSQEKAQIGENSIILNTEEFSSGVYYYSLQVGEEIQTKSFMIEN